jgi:polyisoprenoid-binding protein YceI
LRAAASDKGEGEGACGGAFALALATLLAVLLVTPARAEMMHFRIDPEQTQITVAVEEPFSAVRGSSSATFRVISGDISGDPANIRDTAHATISIDAASYTSSSSLRDRAVKSDALETDKFPTINFASTKIENIAMHDTSGTAAIIGNLTLHGTTREIRVPARARLDGSGVLTADGEFALRYDEFGVNPPTLMFGAIRAGNVANVKFHIVASPAL